MEDQYDNDSFGYNEEQQVEQTQTQIKPKTRKTKKPTDDVSKQNRKLKGVILSITKPSYTLKGKTGGSLRSVHRQRLRFLFRQLVRGQNWDEAAGALSVLLKATRRDGGLLSNKRKYSVALELLEHMGVAKVKPSTIQQVYDIWIKKDYAVTKNNRSPIKGSFDALLEFILFCFSRGDNKRAYQALLSVLQESNVSSDPQPNLVAGLFFSQLWYNSIQEEMQLHESLESSSFMQSGMSGPQQIMSIDQSNRQSTVEVQDSGCHSHSNSNTSIRFGKVIDLDEVADRVAKVKLEVEFDLKRETPDYEDTDSVESNQSGYLSQFPHTGNKQFGSVFYAPDLETFLLPFRYSSTKTFEDFVSLQKKIKNDHYKDAVKHLQKALHSTPPAFEALLPLVQMLLLGDQVKEAIEEVESTVQCFKAALPFRLKAHLLEHFSNEDVTKLCICFEETLKKDPTCSHSLAKLINLHHDGFYSVEKLVEMIAWHLDAVYADSHIWKEFASCFIRLAQCDEDRMSSCVNSYDDSCTERVKNVPDMFKDRNNWRSRCGWWLTRHFTHTILASEIASGNAELLAYKAASACHLYGPESKYVVKAYEYLKKEKSQERLNLKVHMANAIGFYAR